MQEASSTTRGNSIQSTTVSDNFGDKASSKILLISMIKKLPGTNLIIGVHNAEIF